MELTTTASPETLASAEKQRWLLWFGVAVLAAPLAIVLHELGHFTLAKAFGFPDVSFHFSSVNDGAEGAGYPLWQQGIKGLAGPAVTLALVLGFTVAARRYGPGPFTVAPAFAAGVRAVILGGAYLLVRTLHPERAAQGNFDELNAARRLGLSTDLVMAVSVLSIVAAWAYLFRLLPKPIRWKALGATAAGTVVGVVLWVSIIGPIVLP